MCGVMQGVHRHPYHGCGSSDFGGACIPLRMDNACAIIGEVLANDPFQVLYR